MVESHDGQDATATTKERDGRGQAASVDRPEPPMSHNDLDSTDEATFLIGEAVRRVMMGEVKDAPAELMQIARRYK